MTSICFAAGNYAKRAQMHTLLHAQFAVEPESELANVVAPELAASVSHQTCHLSSLHCGATATPQASSTCRLNCNADTSGTG